MGYVKNVPLTEQQQLDKVKGDVERANLATINAAINNEIAARESVDAEIKASVNQLQTALNDEVTLRANNIGNLRQDVTDEIAAERQERILQDSNLQASIDSKCTDLQAEIQTERQTRINEDSAVVQNLTDKYDTITNNISSSLANEITLSASRDEIIFSNLSASIQAEKSARETVDANLQTAINNEVTLRSQQTTSLSSAINNEVTARTNAVNNLQSNLSTAINNEATLRAKNEKDLGDSIKAVYTNINELVDIDEFSPSTTTKDGKSGIVPAPPKLPNTDTKLLLTSDGWEKMADTAIFIGAVPSQNGTIEYNGSTQYPNWINYDENKLQIGGVTSATNAGTYTATFTPRGLYCWSDGTRTARNAVWTIKPKTVQVPTAAVTSYEYTGNSITVGIANPNSDALNKSGVDTSTNAGDFAVTFSLKNTSNYIFSDGSTSNKVINWSITPKKLAKPTASQTSFTYNGNAQSLSISNYDATYIDKVGTDTATAAANYSVTFSLKNTSNFRWSDNSSSNVVINWSIAVLKLAKPTAATTEFTYNGSTKTLSISNYNSNFMTESGTKSQVNAGSYNSIYSLKDKNSSQWETGETSDVTISWKINRMKLSASQSTFSQSGTLTYTGNSQTPTISGYNSTYHDLSSTTSATAAGTYTLKVAPKSNYAFSDGSTAAKSVNWSIGKKTFTKPTASTTEFEYTGNSITLSVTGYDATYMSKSGSDTAVAEGTYSVTFNLKDTSNYQWQDSSNAAVTINWKIKTNKITKPTITAGASQTYSGSTLSPTIANYDANKMSVTGTSSAVNVGTYTLTYALKDTANTTWQDGSTANVVLQWEITRKKLTAAQSTFSQSGTLTYNGSAQSPTISGYNSTYHDLGSDTSKTAAGSYKIAITPKSNYAFSDGSTSAKTCNWSIGKKSLTKPSASVTTFEYDGSTKTLSVSNYNSGLMTQSGTVSSSAKGNYTASYTLNDTANYMWNDSSTAKVDILWSIGAKAIAKPTRTDSNTFTYDGTAKTITVSGYDSNTMTFSGTLSETNAGSYTATYALKDAANYTWQDGTTANLVISWSIARARLSEELSTGFAQAREAVAGPSIYYICTSNDPSANSSNRIPVANTYSQYHSLNNGAIVGGVGNYTARVTPNSNYTWYNGGTNIIEVPVLIKKAQSIKPTANQTSFVYTGNSISVTDASYNSAIISETGTKTATNVGNYGVTFTIKKPAYYEWEDGTTDPITINWEITYGDGITKPTLSTSSVEWSGGNVSPTIANFDSNLMTKTGTDTAVDINTYSITFALKDKTNTKWADGTTADVTLNWQVTRKKLSGVSSIVASGLNADNGEWIGGLYGYTGGTLYPRYRTGGNSAYINTANLSDYYDFGSQTSAVEAGTYTLTVTPKSTYCWSDGTFGTRTYNWSISKVTIYKPSLSNTTFTYDGNSHAPSVSLGDNSAVGNLNTIGSLTDSVSTKFYKLVTKSGEESAVNGGTHTITFTLNNPTSTQWEDKSTDPVSLNWTISPIKLVKPSLSNTTFTYDGNEHAPTINNFDSAVENKSGTEKSTNAGNFTITFSLKNSNYIWADESTANVPCTWKINKIEPTITVSEVDFILTNTESTATVTVTYNGDGSLYCTEAETETRTADLLFLSKSGQNYTYRITAKRRYGTYPRTNGSYYVNIFRSTEGTNYYAITSRKGTNEIHIFTNDYVKPLSDCTWEEIKDISSRGLASKGWNIGDRTQGFNFTTNADQLTGGYKISTGTYCGTLLDIGSSECIFGMSNSNGLVAFHNLNDYGHTGTGYTCFKPGLNTSGTAWGSTGNYLSSNCGTLSNSISDSTLRSNITAHNSYRFWVPRVDNDGEYSIESWDWRKNGVNISASSHMGNGKIKWWTAGSQSSSYPYRWKYVDETGWIHTEDDTDHEIPCYGLFVCFVI